MLSNAYFLAKFRFDTDENEPAKIFQNFANFAKSAFEGDLPASRARSLVDTESETRSASDGGFTSRDGSPQPPPSEVCEDVRGLGSAKLANFEKIEKKLQIFSGLVLGCIKTKFCKKICV